MSGMVRKQFRRRLGQAGMWTLFVVLFAACASLAIRAIVYLLHPGWSDAATPDAPPLPIVVAGVVFNVPPAAIRMPLQRHAGPQERIDLAYRWPTLAPPDSHATDPSARLFVTI